MLRLVPVVLVVGFMIYCFIDCVQTPSAEIRYLPKPAWLVIIVLLGLLGGIAWLLAGRPKSETPGSAWRPGQGAPGAPPQFIAPDDNPEFLRGLRKPQNDKPVSEPGDQPSDQSGREGTGKEDEGDSDSGGVPPRV